MILDLLVTGGSIDRRGRRTARTKSERDLRVGRNLAMAAGATLRDVAAFDAAELAAAAAVGVAHADGALRAGGARRRRTRAVVGVDGSAAAVALIEVVDAARLVE